MDSVILSSSSVLVCYRSEEDGSSNRDELDVDIQCALKWNEVEPSRESSRVESTRSLGGRGRGKNGGGSGGGSGGGGGNEVEASQSRVEWSQVEWRENEHDKSMSNGEGIDGWMWIISSKCGNA
uniref:Uncharacterized protein n=1 Tax=Vespula pensylvanica TaxID=30213 RepID=A0A834NEV0_VESPE|nr:hypothetical protein H0235_014368 [Vespula pensylvanica]